MPIKMKITHEITDEDIMYLFCAALEGGIGYWAPRIDWDKDWVTANIPQPKDTIAELCAQIVCAGGEVTLFADEGEDDLTPYTLNLEKLTSGFDKYFNEWHSPTTEVGDWDSEHSDVIIQFSALGEIVFG